MDKRLKKLWSKTMKNRQNGKYGIVCAKDDRIKNSMMHKPRYRADADGEGYVEYGFVVPEKMVYDNGGDTEALEESYTTISDAEVSEWFEENVVIRIFSPYDCTGKPFTRFLDWHRNPSGLVSYVHHVEYDV